MQHSGTAVHLYSNLGNYERNKAFLLEPFLQEQDVRSSYERNVPLEVFPYFIYLCIGLRRKGNQVQDLNCARSGESVTVVVNSFATALRGGKAHDMDESEDLP